MMTETRLEAEVGWGGYHKIPNQILSEVETPNVGCVGPRVYECGLRICCRVSKSLSREDRETSLRKGKVRTGRSTWSIRTSSQYF